MKRIVMFTVMASMAAVSLRAQSPTCSNATLSGSYGVSVSGTRPAPSVLPTILAALPGYLEQMIGVAIQIFDGTGKFTQTDNVKGNLSGITFDRPGSGIYSVNSDCTGTYTLNNEGLPFPIVTRIVVVEGGKEFRGAVVSPQALMVTANGRKMN